MELSTATRLIAKAIDSHAEGQRWADLGAGNGLFSRALSCLLPDQSEILAIDRNGSVLKGIRSERRGVVIRTQVADFMNMECPPNHFDGILMANALHYVKDQSRFMKILSEMLADHGHLVVLEYELSRSNAWVPYPIMFDQLNHICREAGFRMITRLDEEPSVYHQTIIYSALIQK